jgi:hypothetical protein
MPIGEKINWSNYDDLIKQELPKYTIADFCRKYLPDISEKTVGTRARKLGIKPGRYRTDDHRKNLAKAISKESPELIDKIRELRDGNSLRMIAGKLGIGYATLCRIIKRHNIGLSDEGKIRAANAAKIGKAKVGMPQIKRAQENVDDELIIKYLPSMTIVDFVKKYTPNIPVRVVRWRAKKLGVGCMKYFPTADHKANMSEGIKKKLTVEQLNYIKEWINSKPRHTISKELGVSIYLINKACEQLNISIDLDKMKEFHRVASVDHIDKAINASRERWKDPEFWKRRSKQSSESNKKLWKNERYRLKVRNGLRRAYDNTDLRERLSVLSKQRYENDPRIRETLLSERYFKNSKLNDLVSIKLGSFGLSHEREFKLANYSFDFKIGDTLLEVHGDYWHSLPNNKRNDLAKATIVRRYFPQYKLCVIWENEVKSIRCNERLLEVIGISKPVPEKVDLSELDFVVDPPGNSKFLISFHYLGDTNRRKFVFGLLLYGETIAVAVFGQPVRQNTYPGKVLELVRLCRHPRFFNKNMMSYFLAKCEKQLCGKCDALVSFADSRLHDGAVYRASNWENCGLTSNDYQYMSVDNIPMHKKTLYNRARACGLTEREYAELHNYKKTDIGKKRKFIKQFIGGPRNDTRESQGEQEDYMGE